MTLRNALPRKIMLIPLLIVLGVAAALGTLYVKQRSLLYFPSRIVGTPAEAGLGSAEVVSLKTRDGETLSGWYLKGRNDKIIVYFHGNGGNIANRPYRLKDLNDRGFSVLAIDYRGYGASTGTPTETGLHMDADAAYDLAIAKGFSGERILLFGESLGSGVALELATRRPVAGIILDSPYSSVVDVAAARYPFLPVRLLMQDQFRSDLWIKMTKVPVLIMHGTDDIVIPIVFARKLVSLGGPNVSYIEVPGGGHLAWDDVSDDSRVDVWLKRFGSD
jgi:fermentation-respiration switch protein FrsA (DUF1100 family)